jgi:hypothetical protein
MLPRDDILGLLDELADRLEPQGLHGDDPDATVLFERPGLSVRVASPGYLFAMKVLAARVERDEDDIRALYRLCRFASVDDALGHVERLYPHRPIPPRAQYLLEELFPPS